MNPYDVPFWLLGAAAGLLLLTFCLLVVSIMVLLAFALVLGTIDMWRSWRARP